MYLFVGSLMVVQALYEIDPKAISGSAVRKGLGWLDGQGWVDRAAVRAEGEEGVKKDEEIKRRLSERETKQEGFPFEEEEESLPAEEKKDA